MDPVLAADGYTYERSSIEQWFSLGKNTSPMTNQPLSHAQVTPNLAVFCAAQILRDFAA